MPNAPATISAGRNERPARTDAPIARAATNATASETPRAVATAKGTLASAARSAKTK